jgi:spermidine synthase
MQLLLLVSVFVVATCGLIYELVAGTLASYLLGDSVTQFSTIIGAYLFSMGIGSWLSRFFSRNLIGWFIQVEILVGAVGGVSSALLFLLFPYVESFRVILYLLTGLTGILVGLEIPLLLRILKDKIEFRDLVSRVFTFDYIGALLASVIFPLALVPWLGLIRTSMLFGILNVAVALILCFRFSGEVSWTKYLRVSGILTILLLLTGFVYADQLMRFSENSSYPDKIIYAQSTPYQRIVLTKGSNEMRLYLNGNLQFSSADEYRYHEALVHPGLAAVPQAKNVLILGGGDGLAAREALKYPDVKSITLVDLDGQMTALFRTNNLLTALNEKSFSNPRVKVINTDAFVWLRECHDLFDFIVVDFPDPSNYSIGKLYSKTFYDELNRVLAPEGIATIQSTSPYFARNAFWCINHTLESAGFRTFPYHVNVPSFGEWGYVIVTKGKTYTSPVKFPSGLRYIDAQESAAIMKFPKDIGPVETEINRLNNQALVHYFENEWPNVQ